MRKIAELETEEGRKNFNWKIGRFYMTARQKKYDRMNLDEILWDREVPEVYQACKTLGITKVTISDQSTALMRTLQAFVNLGCSIGKMVNISDGTTLEIVNGELQEVPVSKPAITIIIK